MKVTPKVKTTGEPSVNLFEEATKEFTDRLATTKTKAAPLPDEVRSAPSTKTTTKAAPLDEVAVPGADPAVEPLVFFAPAPVTVPKRTAAAAEAQPVVFISSDPAPKTPTTAAAPKVRAAKVKTTGEPSVNLFEEAAEAFVQTLRPEATPATPRVFMEEDFSKIAGYEPITVEEVSPFTVTKTAPAAAPQTVTKIDSLVKTRFEEVPAISHICALPYVGVVYGIETVYCTPARVRLF